MAPTILVVDDEEDLVDTLTYNLEAAGYETRSAGNGADALSEARRSPRPDLVLLDLMLPDLSGTDVCRKLRADERTKEIPVIMLTAKSDEVDRVVGFEVGADDYVVKPFSVRELMLRVRAILKRGGGDSSKEAETVLTHDELVVDKDRHRVTVAGVESTLTALEFRLLVTLMERRGRVQSRNTLLADVWGVNPDVSTRTVDTHVKRLREKLGAAGQYIETVRGVGYRLSDSTAVLNGSDATKPQKTDAAD